MGNPIYQWGRAYFVGPWTEPEADAFEQRVREIMAEEAARDHGATHDEA